jgi:2-polyprenyl-3-methyl-5-hydroxy-6-metoxy-1,4-benzoquinol methylase
MPYPSRLAYAVGDELSVGVDADHNMIVEARRAALSAGVRHVEWRQMRAEELPADLGIFRVVTFAQSFHWMDQEAVARQVRDMLSADGAWVHVFATTHRGVVGDDPAAVPARGGTGEACSGCTW